MCILILVNKVRSQTSDISRTPLGGGDSTDRPHNAYLRKLNFTNTLYQLAYSLVLCVITAPQQIVSYYYGELAMIGFVIKCMPTLG
jgi:hypothetical protein